MAANRRKIHPAANIFPMMTDEEFAELKASILEDGQVKPIELYEGEVLDGRNRYLACEQLGVEPLFAELDPRKIGDPLRYVVNTNLHRRHLTVGQRAIAAANYARAMAEKQNSSGNPQNPPPTNGGETSSANLRSGKVSEQAAAAFGISPRTVENATKVIKRGAKAVVDRVAAGDMSLHSAVKIVDDHETKAEQVAALKTQDDEEPPPPPAVDEVGQTLPEHLRESFAVRRRFRELHSEIGKIAKAVETELATSPAAIYLHLQSFKGDMKNAQMALKYAAPYAVCPYCKGKRNLPKECGACKDVGFVNRLIYDNAPSEMRVAKAGAKPRK